MQSLQSSSLHGVRLQCRAPRVQRASRAATQTVRAAKTADGPVLAIVGVTGAVGQEFLRVGTPG